MIIGGGAAGFFAAANLDSAHVKNGVLLLEAGNRVMTKVRISGGGRCNVTHHEFDIRRLSEHYPRGGRELRGAFSRFQPRDLVSWMKNHGVPTKTESDGRVFPESDDSATVIRCLREQATRCGTRILTGKRVKSVIPEAGGFTVRCSGGEVFRSRFVLIATGGHPSGHALARSIGHTIVPPVPSLFTFNIRDARLESLAGVSFPHVALQLQCGGKTVKQQGALLITHWGLSGPVILKSSAWAARALHDSGYEGRMLINFAPADTDEQIRATLELLFREHAKKELSSLTIPWLPRRYWKQLAGHICDPGTRCAEISKKTTNLLVDEIRRAEFSFKGKSTNKEEFVTAGGVELREIDFSMMESKICPNLFFAGEVLNVDGVTGGFNFQNAWTTAFLCSSAINLRLAP